MKGISAAWLPFSDKSTKSTMTLDFQIKPEWKRLALNLAISLNHAVSGDFGHYPESDLKDPEGNRIFSWSSNPLPLIRPGRF